MNSHTLVAGIGSPSGDDQLGWLVIDALRRGLPPARRPLLRQAATPMQLLDWLDDICAAVIVDACQGVGDVGTISSWRWPDSRLDQTRFVGTHDYPLAATLRLAQRLGKLPADVEIWTVTIDTAQDQPDHGLSPPVAAAVPALLERMQVRLAGAAKCMNNPS